MNRTDRYDAFGELENLPFCLDYQEDALRGCGKPEIFNSDQGMQFTSHALTCVL